MFGKITRLIESRVSDCRCKDLMLLRFYLQMLNDKILKPNKINSNRYITISEEKMLQLIISAFFEKWV